MNSVCVLMSTYNGSRYLKEQIDSIFSQKNVDLRLIVRDDGSNDDTLDILHNYLDKNERIKIFAERNIGAANSFMQLIKLASDAEYYAFSDQDDIWDDDKIYVAIQKLKEIKKPAMYFCNYRQIDSSGNLLFDGSERKIENKCLEEVVLTNNCTGCTVVFNDAMRVELCKHIPQNVIMHDHWIYLLTKAIGGFVFCDSESHISYRQHDSNVLGARMSFANKVKMSSLGKNKGLRSSLVRFILENYADRVVQKEILYLIAYYKKGMKVKTFKTLAKFEPSLLRKVILGLNILIGVF